VLVEHPADLDRHHLHAAADAEHRQVELRRDPRQGELPLVAVRPGLLRRRVRLGVVAVGLDVGSSRDDQAVDPGEHRGGQLVVGVRARRQHDDDGPGPLELVDVPVRQHGAALGTPR
jgi:hypothetical protein